jgi:hypothetical protein
LVLCCVAYYLSDFVYLSSQLCLTLSFRKRDSNTFHSTLFVIKCVCKDFLNLKALSLVIGIICVYRYCSIMAALRVVLVDNGCVIRAF